MPCLHSEPNMAELHEKYFDPTSILSEDAVSATAACYELSWTSAAVGILQYYAGQFMKMYSMQVEYWFAVSLRNGLWAADGTLRVPALCEASGPGTGANKHIRRCECELWAVAALSRPQKQQRPSKNHCLHNQQLQLQHCQQNRTNNNLTRQQQ